MEVSDLLQPYVADEKLKNIAGKLNENTPSHLHLKGLVGSVVSFVAAALSKSVKKNFVFILNDKEEAAYFLNDLQSLTEKKEVIFFPDSFKKPGNFQEVNNNHVQLRTEALNQLMNSVTKNELFVTYPEALAEKVVNNASLKKSTITIQLNNKLNLDFMIETLVEYRFERVDFVYEPGQFSLRGGIVDVFSFGNELPYRIELFGEDVESIRLFDPLTQLSQRKISLVTIVPNIQTQFSSNEKTSFFNSLNENVIVFAKDFNFVFQKIKQCFEGANDLEEQLKEVHAKAQRRKEEEEENEIDFSADSFVSEEVIRNEIENLHTVEFGSHSFFQSSNSFPLGEDRWGCKPQPSFNKNFSLLIADLKKNEQNKIQNFIFSENTKQLERLQIIFEDLKVVGQETNNGVVKFQPVKLSLTSGFVDEERKVACYTDHQIFERYHRYQLKQGYSKSKAINLKLLHELKPGDFVTHIDHGVGVFSGLQKMDVGGQQQECVRIVYRDTDLLYVNIQSLHKISKYVGKDGTPPRVSKLGSDAWEKLKTRTKSKVKDIAKDLIKLYAKRKASSGFAFTPDSYLQTELEASFIYEDTPDQLKATNDVKRDMEKNFPMDRLVCGDVGFGKTEVAIRAAFKAVADGKQVAVLVPTTILAIQHWKTFQERLKDFPCTIDYLNRFKTSAQQKETLERLADGKIDIIIGTSAIIAKRVKFKNLGLLVVDEEQKFGVTTKERLRELKADVDTLTLTATPIPRTLQFSLLGARDLSVINTPPPNRQPIETEVLEFNADRIKEAIEFEVYRGGQVFFIHNRVRDIEEVAGMLKSMCPSVEFSVAHGQMEGEQLEQKMIDFVERKIDVLVCTNIVESGLDIENANTIIINDAQHHGLSDLHQLRGRVGRSNKKAFCYLTTPPTSVLTSDARKRLQTIEDFAELGSGFQISMRDMDIRGAGNLLGAEQSGFIADIGYDTYHKILDEAISELKHGEFKDLYEDNNAEQKVFVRDCTVDCDFEMLIPDEYVSNIQERLILYTELDNVETEEELIVFENKLRDRFGEVPKQVYELFDGLRLRNAAKQLGFEKIILKQGMMKCFFISNPESAYYNSEVFTQVIGFVNKNQNRCALKQQGEKYSLLIRHIHSLKDAIEMLGKIPVL